MARRKSRYVFTPARAASLAKARRVSAARRSMHGQKARATKKTIENSKGKFKPYARFTRHSQTIGIEGRSPVIPGTKYKRRFVAGAHVRLEKTTGTTLADKAIPTTRIRHGKVRTGLGQYVKEAKIPTGRRGGRSSAV